jgi:hypothetical protein
LKENPAPSLVAWNDVPARHPVLMVAVTLERLADESQKSGMERRPRGVSFLLGHASSRLAASMRFLSFFSPPIRTDEVFMSLMKK